MHLKPSPLISAVLPLCVLAAMLAGCRVNISVGSNSYITGENYPDARKYKTGTFTYAADEVKAVEVYWRSGEIALIESGASKLSVSESGGESGGELFTERSFTRRGALYVFGSGECRLTVETSSGNLEIR